MSKLEEMREEGREGEVKVSGGKVHSRSDGRREGEEVGKRRRVRSGSYGETESGGELSWKELQRSEGKKDHRGGKKDQWRRREREEGE